MSQQSFACPACGTRKTLTDFHPGEKLHCTCGMSFPASPVFAVADGEVITGGPSALLVVSAGLLIGCGIVAVWQWTHPRRHSPDRHSEAVAIAPTPVYRQPDASSSGDVTPSPTDPSPAPPTPAERPPVKPKVPPPPPLVPVATVSADTLWDAFDLDPVAAASKYVDKMVEVKARGRIARDSIDRPYFGAVVVKSRGRTTPRMSAEEKQWEKVGYPPSVRCYLSEEDAANLEKTPGDQEVEFRGICTGRKNRSDAYRGYIVELSHCTIVTPK